MIEAPRITLLSSQEKSLREYLESSAVGHERAAVILFRRFKVCVDGMSNSDRYVAVDVVPFEDNWVTSSSPSHISFELKYLRNLFRRCEEEGLVFGFVHNHPTGFPAFSDLDEQNEQTLLIALANRNGRDVHFIAMLWTNGEWRARIRHGATPEISVQARHVFVVGSNVVMYGYARTDQNNEDISARQAAAFGQPFVDMLRSLRIGIVGAGGTGSPTTTLLARAGVGELILFDRDELEESNLNRVRGAGMRDVGKNKALILRDFIKNMGLPTTVTAVQSLIDEDPSAIDALASCDIIFGCTDDQIGREVLNSAAYIYAQAYIDVGLGGQVVEDANGYARLRYHFGRISTILPEAGECLFCQDVIRPAWIQHQYALRENPALSEEEAKQRYLDGGGEQAPGVGPFTSAVADYGVASLFNLLRPFRKLSPEVRADLYMVDFVKMDIRSRQLKDDPECMFCQKKEFLLVKEKYRLNRPALGKRDVYL